MGLSRVNALAIAMILAFAVIAGGIVTGYVGVLQMAIAADRAESSQLPPCETEDSTGCYWDADTMGNGTGHDVVTVERVER